MKKIILCPIEPLPDRYSLDWLKWTRTAFDEQGVDYITVNPAPLSEKISNGSFLDVCGTNHYKAMQTSIVSEMLYQNAYRKEIKDGDVFFFHDIWNFGVVALAYMRDALGIDFKIVGCLHAGTYDPFDFLAKKGMQYWGEPLENSWFRIVDKIFVATNFHKDFILSKREVDPRKIVVTGWPAFYEGTHVEKENIVVFPHRLDSEKNPELFRIMKNNFGKVSTWRFLFSKEETKTKQEYLSLLERAKISVSFADQETYGYAMVESLFANCLPLVPDRLSYKELYSQAFQYANFNECSAKLFFMMSHVKDYEEHLNWNKTYLEILGAKAIPNMIDEMNKL